MILNCRLSSIISCQSALVFPHGSSSSPRNQINRIIYISICSTHHALAKYVKIFEKFCLIIRDIVIFSELCMEFGKKKLFLFCVSIYLSYCFFRNKKYYFVWLTKLYFKIFCVRAIFFWVTNTISHYFKNETTHFWISYKVLYFSNNFFQKGQWDQHLFSKFLLIWFRKFWFVNRSLLEKNFLS